MELTDPDIARIVGDGDQLCEMMARFAAATTRYFTGLMNGGMTRDEALTMTMQWHEMWLMSHMTVETPFPDGR